MDIYERIIDANANMCVSVGGLWHIFYDSHGGPEMVTRKSESEP